MQTIYRAAKYKRTSGPDNEAEYRDSIENQDRLIDYYLSNHPDIQVIMDQADEGYSGLFFDRPGLKKILAAIKAGKINCLVVKDLSRLGRDYIEIGRYLRNFFPEHGVRLISKVTHTHQPIVSKQDYDAVQRALALDSRTAPHQRNVYLFSGMLICGHCGKHMTRKTVKSNSRSYHYYDCPAPKSYCNFVGMIPEKQLDDLVLQKIQKHISDVETLFVTLSNQQTEKQIRQEFVSELADIEEKIHMTLGFRFSLQDSLSARIIGETEYWSLQSFYESELCRLSEEEIAIQRKLISGDSEILLNDVWENPFLQFKNLLKLDRKSVLLMVENICLLSKTDIDIRFTYQSEYEQVINYLRQRGNGYGTEEQKTQ